MLGKDVLPVSVDVKVEIPADRDELLPRKHETSCLGVGWLPPHLFSLRSGHLVVLQDWLNTLCTPIGSSLGSRLAFVRLRSLIYCQPHRPTGRPSSSSSR